MNPGRFTGGGRKTTAIIFAIGVHVLVLIVLGVSFNWKPHLVTARTPSVQPIQATTVSEAELSKELELIADREEQKRQVEEQQQQRVEDLIQQAEQLEAQRQEQQQALAKVEQERKQAEQKRAEEEQRVAALKKEAEEKQRKDEQAQRVAEQKKQEEAERQRKLAEEKKKQDEAERQRQLAEQKKKEEAERQRKLAEEKQRKAQEQKRLAEQQARDRIEAVGALNDQYGMIQRAVSRNWIQPSGFVPGQTAKVRVRVGRGGEVVDARVVAGSGDTVFDRSVYNAVLKASPLPIPDNPRYYEYIKEFDIVFNPYG